MEYRFFVLLGGVLGNDLAGSDVTMNYREVLDRVSPCIPIEHIAQEARVDESRIRRARLEPASEFYLPPPPNWRRVIVRLAWEKSGLLLALANELERDADQATVQAWKQEWDC